MQIQSLEASLPKTSGEPQQPSNASPLEPFLKGPARLWGLLLLLAALWLMVFNQLRFEWTVNPVYSYGWAIPFLAGYLLWERWNQRPSPATIRPGRYHYLFPMLLLVSLLPIRILQEANPDWILIYWILAAVGTGFTFWTLYHFGGRSWIFYFAFPVLFIFTAVPWPVAMENAILQGLMQVNAALAAETLSLYGMPAFVQGNLIFIGNELVGVDEACSGIRSLQTAFMMSLFLGEFYRLSVTRRVLLLLSSFVLAFLFNFGRTLTLTYIGGTQGSASLESWHDPLGIGVLACCIGGLWLLALAFTRKRDAEPQLPSNEVTATCLRPVSVAFLVIGGLVILGAELLNAAWYKSRENNLVDRPVWSVEWEETSTAFTSHEFSETTRTILKYNEGSSASWTSREGDKWSAYYLRWHPGRVSRYLATAHSPEVCLPAAGMQLMADLGGTTLPINGMEMPFRAYLFEAGTRQLYVFHSLLEDRYPNDENSLGTRHLDRNTRLEAALQGRRNLGQRVIGLSIHGPNSLQEAEGAVRRELETIVKIAGQEKT